MFDGKDKYDEFLIEKLEITFPISNLVHHLTYYRLRLLLIAFEQKLQDDQERDNNTLLSG
jgi:hypothetical protein